MNRRICLLTGASGFLGAAFLARLARQYDIVAVHHRGEVRFASQDHAFVDPLDPASASPPNDRAVHTIRTDLTALADPADAEQFVRSAAARFGGIDLVVHAAALRPQASVLDGAGVIAAPDVFAVNVLAPLRIAAALGRTVWRLDPLVNARAGRNIVHLTSTSGQFVYEDRGEALASSADAALNQLTYHLASELWDLGVRVNALAIEPPLDRAAVERAIDAIVALDDSQDTGRILPVGHPGNAGGDGRSQREPGLGVAG